MENKRLLKLVLAPGILFLVSLSLFIIFAREEAQEFYGLSSTTVTGESNFLFYPLSIYMFLIGCGVMYFKTEQLKFIEAWLCMGIVFPIIRLFSMIISGVELSNFILLALPGEVLLGPIIGYLWYQERKNLQS